MTHPVPPYGVAIQDAIASGDVGKMQSVAADAEKYLQEFGEISDGLKKLYDAIGHHGGGGGYGGIVPLYGVVIRGAIQSGDKAQMQAVAQQAENYLNQVDEIRSALADLKGSMG